MPAQPPKTPGRGMWKSFRMFAPLPPEVLDALAAAARPHRWQPGEMLFQRGDAGDWLVAISAGQVRISIATSGGRELVLRHAEAGEMLGELALFDAEPRSADAFAVGEVTGQVLDRAAFRAIAARYPALYDSALAHLCAMLRGTTDQLESIALYQLQARVARFFLLALRQLHGEDIPQGAALDLAISQGELAALTGASRPKVNRVLADLRAAGALVQDGTIWRCDPAALQGFAGDDG